MDPIRCPRCQKPLPSVASYCPQCGMSVRQAKQQPARRPAETPVPALAKPSRGPMLLVLLIVAIVAFMMAMRSVWRPVSRPMPVPRSVRSAVNIPTFMGIGSPADRVAYVCTADASSQSTINMFLTEMRQSVGRLINSQSFNVCFTAASAGMLDPYHLIQADSTNKRRATDMGGRLSFADTPSDVTAIQRVLSQRPQVVFLVADADLSPDNEQFVSTCRALGRGIRIYTIAVRTRENQADARRLRFEGALQRIAAESGGQFKIVQGR